MNRSAWLVAGGAILLQGCVTAHQYQPPYAPPPANNVKLIDRPRDAVWASTIPAIGSQFFVINNIDKASGLMNISYTGDPQQYVDCGYVTVKTEGASGPDMNLTFPAAKGSVTYQHLQVMDRWQVRRNLTLDGRVNLIFEETSPTQTRVTANTRYVLNRSVNATAAGKYPQSFSDQISFSSGQSGAFEPRSSDSQRTTCIPTGAMERAVLDLVK